MFGVLLMSLPIFIAARSRQPWVATVEHGEISATHTEPTPGEWLVAFDAKYRESPRMKAAKLGAVAAGHKFRALEELWVGERLWVRAEIDAGGTSGWLRQRSKGGKMLLEDHSRHHLRPQPTPSPRSARAAVGVPPPPTIVSDSPAPALILASDNGQLEAQTPQETQSREELGRRDAHASKAETASDPSELSSQQRARFELSTAQYARGNEAEEKRQAEKQETADLWKAFPRIGEKTVMQWLDMPTYVAAIRNKEPRPPLVVAGVAISRETVLGSVAALMLLVLGLGVRGIGTTTVAVAGANGRGTDSDVLPPPSPSFATAAAAVSAGRHRGTAIVTGSGTPSRRRRFPSKPVGSPAKAAAKWQNAASVGVAATRAATRTPGEGEQPQRYCEERDSVTWQTAEEEAVAFRELRRRVELFRQEYTNDATNPVGSTEWLTEGCLMRYLRANKGAVDVAATMLEETCAWREAADPMHIDCGLCCDVTGTHTWRQIGFDKQARPVVYSCPKQEPVGAKNNPHDSCAHITFALEEAAKTMAEGVEQWTWAMDMSGFGLRHADPRFPAYMGPLFSKHYPVRTSPAQALCLWLPALLPQQFYS